MSLASVAGRGAQWETAAVHILALGLLRCSAARAVTPVPLTGLALLVRQHQEIPSLTVFTLFQGLHGPYPFGQS